LTGEAGNASRRKVIVEATARSLEWASAWRTQDESGPTFSRVIRTNFGDRMAKIFRENSDSLAKQRNLLEKSTLYGKDGLVTGSKHGKAVLLQRFEPAHEAVLRVKVTKYVLRYLKEYGLNHRGRQLIN
jgi:hypothetical protein